MKLKKIMNKKKNNFIFVSLFIFLLFLGGCKNNLDEEVVEDIICGSTTLQDYQEYLQVSNERIDYFSLVNLALILDTSGSMYGDRLNRAKSSASWLVDEIDPRISLGLIEFNTNSSVLQDFTKDKDFLKESISKISARGSTYYLPALELTNRLFDYSASNLNIIKDLVIFISDGEPKDNYNEIISQVNQLVDRKICVYTIQYTSEEDVNYEEQLEMQRVLKTMAQISQEKTECGKFYSNIANEESLVEVFSEIYKQIKSINYEAFLDIQTNSKFYMVNETIKIPFRLLSVYNLKQIPNNQECISPLDVRLEFKKELEKLENVNYTITENKNSYDLIINNLDLGNYEINFDVFFGKDEVDSIKAFKNINFRVVDNKEYLKCSQYNCKDYSFAIQNEILNEINIELKKNYCLNEDLTFNKTTKINFINNNNFGKIIEIVQDDVSFFSNIIKPNSSFSYVFENNQNYKINCFYTTEEFFETDNLKDLIIAIDNSNSMNGFKIKQAKLISKELAKNRFDKNLNKTNLDKLNITKKPTNEISIIEFNEFSRKINFENNLLSMKNNIDSIKTQGNSNFLELLNFISNNDNNKSLFEIVIFTDGILHNEIKNTRNLVNESYLDLIKKGHCFNFIVYGDSFDFLDIIEQSKNITNCSLKIIKDESNSSLKDLYRKITIKDYLKNSFEIENKIIYEKNEDLFSNTLDFEIEIDIEEKNFSNGEDNFFNILCDTNLEVIVGLYKDNSLFQNLKAKPVTKNKYHVEFKNVPKYNYEIKTQINLLDSNNLICQDISSVKKDLVDFSEKLLVG